MPLASLRVFVAVAEQLSFSRAAQMLGVSTAAVSQQIRTLEGYLRVPLFLRHGNSILLTGEGQGFFHGCAMPWASLSARSTKRVTSAAWVR